MSVTAASTSSTSIRISWQAPLLELQNGRITSYRITVSELETGLVRTFSTVPTDNIYVVNYLHPFYNYNCSVAAYTIGLGPIAYSEVQTPQDGEIFCFINQATAIFLLFSGPSEPPSNVTVLPMNASTVMVSWSPLSEEDKNGIIQGYTVRVVGVHTDENITLSVTTTETIVGGLHPFYSYEFRVAAVTILHGPFSNPETAIMPPIGKSSF